MRGLLPSVWLVGAALYTALTLFLCRPVSEDWPLPPRSNETVVAKQPPRTARLIFNDDILKKQVAATPAPATAAEWRNEYVQVSEYTAVGRVYPAATSPVLFAYSVGRPLRVIARADGFVRVQDLGSGQLGWVRETALAPFTGGYRLREPTVSAPVVAMAEPAATIETPQVADVVAPVADAVAPVAVKKVRQRRKDGVADQPREQTVAAVQPAARGLFRWKRDRVQRVAYDSEDNGVAAIMRRALSRF
jgi:hypothetical protein